IRLFLFLIEPAMDDVLAMLHRIILLRSLCQRDQAVCIELTIQKEHRFMDGFGGSVKSESVNLSSEIDPEDGRNRCDFRLIVGLFHLGQNEFADGIRAERVAIQMRQPGRVFRDIAAAERSGEAGDRYTGGEANGDTDGSEDVSFHAKECGLLREKCTKN